MAAPSKNGTRYLGMSPRGGIAKPPWVELTACRQCCQLARICSRREACGIAYSVLAWWATGIKQAPRQTALPSKLCAPLDVSRIAHEWERADVFLSPQISSDRFSRRVFPCGRDAVRVRANRSRHDCHRSYDARIASGGIFVCPNRTGQRG